MGLGTRRLLSAGCFYTAWFVALTWPAARHFTTHLLTDTGDGMTNLWNLWWIPKAVVELHTSPFYTTYLHFPHGASLLAHTLNPFNGFVAIPLRLAFSLTVTHNLIVAFGFVMGGVTAWALCRHVSGSHWGSLWGGFVFTFSSFHFAHAQGHMPLVSLEWIPLFLLCWLRWLEAPGVARAAAAAFVLVLVFLCDLYFTVFSLLTAAILTLWWGLPRLLRDRRALGSLAVFAALALPPIGGFAWALLAADRRDPFLGSHDPALYGMDLLAPFIYGGHWRFASWTRPFWGRVTGNIHESSLHLGWSVLAALAFAAWQRRRIERPGVGVWFAVAAIFTLLALGPVLHVWGRSIEVIPMPYRAFEVVFPPARLGGAACRFFVMTYLAAGVLLALVYPVLRGGVLAGRVRPALALAVLAFEYWPAPLPSTRIPVPPSIAAVAAAPGDGAVVDLVNKRGYQLFFQTIHGKPMAGGFIGRYPTSTVVLGYQTNLLVDSLFRGDDSSRESAQKLARAGFRYVIAPRSAAPVPFLAQRHADEDVVVYDLPVD